MVIWGDWFGEDVSNFSNFDAKTILAGGVKCIYSGDHAFAFVMRNGNCVSFTLAIHNLIFVFFSFFERCGSFVGRFNIGGCGGDRGKMF